MITRIEIDGLKPFVGFGLDVRPCTVLMGVNGSGKSNLQDALDLVRRVADGGPDRALGGGNPRPAVRRLFHRGEGPGGPRSATEFTIKIGMTVPSGFWPLPVVARIAVGDARGGRVRLDRRPSALWVSSLTDASWTGRLGLPDALGGALADARDAAARRHQSGYPLGEGPGSDRAGGADPAGEAAGSGMLRTLPVRGTRAWKRFCPEPSAMRSPHGGTPDAGPRSDGTLRRSPVAGASGRGPLRLPVRAPAGRGTCQPLAGPPRPPREGARRRPEERAQPASPTRSGRPTSMKH